MGTRLLEFGEIRLVINQSVVPMNLESSPEDRSCLSAICYLRLYSQYITYQYKEYNLDSKQWNDNSDLWVKTSIS